MVGSDITTIVSELLMVGPTGSLTYLVMTTLCKRYCPVTSPLRNKTSELLLTYKSGNCLLISPFRSTVLSFQTIGLLSLSITIDCPPES